MPFDKLSANGVGLAIVTFDNAPPTEREKPWNSATGRPASVRTLTL